MSSKISTFSKLQAKFNDGKLVAAPKASTAGTATQKQVVKAVGHVAFGVGAAVGSVSAFAKSLFN